MKIRKCTICGNDFEATRPVWRCRPCINRLASEKRKLTIEERKAHGLYRGPHGRPPDLDGFDYEERLVQWKEKRKYLDEIEDRVEWQALFYDEFNRILNDKELWKSLTRPTLAEDIRGAESVKGKQRGVIGRPRNESKAYPDTRNVNIDDISNYRVEQD